MTEKLNTQIDKAALLRTFEKDYFAKSVGLEIVEIGQGFARVRVRVNQQHLNALGKTHGAALFAAADFALAVASNSYGEAAVATNVTISYIKASTEGSVLEAVATEESRTRRTGLYRIEIRDELGQKLALAHGSVYLLGQSIL
ncbi:MAG: hotdog fold thioesterase [Bacillota bacterium]